jgi:hypothetical protein
MRENVVEELETACWVFCPPLRISWLFLRIYMPYHIIWKTVHPISGSFRHFREPFGLGLVLERVAGEINA